MQWKENKDSICSTRMCILHLGPMQAPADDAKSFLLSTATFSSRQVGHANDDKLLIRDGKGR